MHRRQLIAALATSLGTGAVVAQPAGRELGSGRRAYGERAEAESGSVRFFAPSATPGTGASRTPLQDALGIITPSGLHFERHHSGVPVIDATHLELLVHGLVETPLVFSMDDRRRMPSTSRIHFIECAGNSGREHAGNPGETAQKSHGLAS
jgi:sulfane dehydrogenase subunit SoxC